jgi:hypothetical protein
MDTLYNKIGVLTLSIELHEYMTIEKMLFILQHKTREHGFAD